MTPQECDAVVRAFVDAINRRDIDGISRLMSEDHLFIDSLGAEIRGREAMRQAWIGYGVMVPDYRITVETALPGDGVVALFGRASGTLSPDGSLDPANHWEMPAAWRAVVRNSHIAVWQVYADNEQVRDKLASWKGRGTSR